MNSKSLSLSELRTITDTILKSKLWAECSSSCHAVTLTSKFRLFCC